MRESDSAGIVMDIRRIDTRQMRKVDSAMAIDLMKHSIGLSTCGRSYAVQPDLP